MPGHPGDDRDDVEGLEPEIEHRSGCASPRTPRRRSRADMLDRRLRQDAVAEIEDVRPAAHRVEDARRRRSSSASPPAIRASGSRLPCVATRPAARRAAPRGSSVQSSAERVADAGLRRSVERCAPPPRTKTMIRGLRAGAPSRLGTMRPIGSSDSGSNSAGGRAAPKLSKICTASAPASSWPTDRRPRPSTSAVDQRRHEGRVAIGARAGPAPGRACPCRRSCSSPPSRARRRSRAASSRRAAPPRSRSSGLEDRREPLERQVARRARRGRPRSVTGSSRGPSPSTKRTSCPSACGIDEDVGEQDRRVEAEAADRLQRHLGGERAACSRGRGTIRPAGARRPVLRAGSARPGA